MFESLRNLRLIQPRTVGQQHQFEKRGIGQGAHVNDGLDGFGEIGRQRGLTVAAQCDMAQLQQFIRHGAEPGALPQTAVAHKRDGLSQLRRHHVHVQTRLARGDRPVHFAIEAIEVALLVRVHVDADG